MQLGGHVPASSAEDPSSDAIRKTPQCQSPHGLSLPPGRSLSRFGPRCVRISVPRRSAHRARAPSPGWETPGATLSPSLGASSLALFVQGYVFFAARKRPVPAQPRGAAHADRANTTRPLAPRRRRSRDPPPTLGPTTTSTGSTRPSRPRSRAACARPQSPGRAPASHRISFAGWRIPCSGSRIPASEHAHDAPPHGRDLTCRARAGAASLPLSILSPMAHYVNGHMASSHCYFQRLWGAYLENPSKATLTTAYPKLEVPSGSDHMSHPHTF